MRIKVVAAAICLGFTALAGASGAGGVRTATDIPPQDLGPALQALAKARNFQVIYISEEIGKLRTRGASGELTEAEALTQLLDGTGLTYRYLDEKTVTIVPIGKKTAASHTSNADVMQARWQLVKAGPLAAVTAVEADEPIPPDAKDEEQDTSEVRVTGSRIRRDPAESQANPVTVYTRQDIERSGAMVISDFIGRITQANYDYSKRETDHFPGSGRTTVNLRGLGNNTTLVLLNGRRLPKGGQGFGFDDYDLNGIPLASVERIEVLTNSASAIYGADAIGGVVNIITRTEYSGLDVKLQYGNTTRTDVEEKSAALTFGHNGELSRGARGYSVMLNLTANDRGYLMASARPYTALYDYSATGGRPLPAPTPFSFATIAGTGSVATPFFRFDPTPLPGLPTNWVAIPRNQDGRNLAPEDFLDSGPIVTDKQDVPDYRQLLPPSSEKSAMLFSSLNLTPNAQLFLDASHYVYRTDFQGTPPTAEINVPADNPFNPFGTEVVVSKMFYELGPSRGIRETRNSRLAAGVRGAFLRNWRYELSSDYSRYVGESTNPTPSTINFYPQFEIVGDEVIEIPTPGYLAVHETDPDRALNVFNDPHTHPNDPQRLREILGTDDYREDSETMTTLFQADGDLMMLPAGMVKLAFGAEYRKEKVDFYKFNDTGRYFVSLDDGAQRNLRAAFVELSVPLIGEHQGVPGVKLLQASVAGRLDSESLFGEELTPKFGLMWKPFGQLTLRSSYSRGYKTPNLQQLFAPDETSETLYFPPYPVDPVTEQVLDDWFMVRQGGNIDLNPERSVSWSAGLIYEPRWLPGLSLTVDYFDIDYTDRVSSFISVQDILTFFPERVTRDPDTNAVVLIDTRAINLSKATAEGVDVSLVHHLRTARRGMFDTRLNYTYNISNTEQTTPTSEVIERVDSAFFPRVRMNLQTFWTYGPFELGPTITYDASTRNELYGGATAPLRIRRAVVVDLQGSYDFGVAGRRGWAGWTDDLKVIFGIHNLFDRRPSPTDGEGGYAKIDPRQRHFYLSLRKHF